jgi:uncharacterized DUF497 family protein
MIEALVDWDDPNDPHGNTSHVAEHGLTPDEVESVLLAPRSIQEVSRSTERPAVFGTTFTGKHIVVIFEWLHEDEPTIVRPVTAYEVN